MNKLALPIPSLRNDHLAKIAKSLRSVKSPHRGHSDPLYLSAPVEVSQPNHGAHIMKLSLALALAAFLGFGAVSAVFAQDAMGGITSARGGYGSTNN
jgi:hypothetical protein